jgi:negative regulator of genetic competence, sporulation and motility
MELIIINENKLKILMSAKEMKSYGLDENEFHLSISDTRKILSKILHNSPTKTGFESLSPDEKILLQLYPEKKGGCELYVTRLSLDEKHTDKEKQIMSADENSLLPVFIGSEPSEKKPLICYSFEGLKNITLSCKALKKYDCSEESSVYVDDDNRYYLMIKSQPSVSQKSTLSSVLSEFGEIINAEQTMLRMSEYGRCICTNNAIAIFSEL